MLIIVIRVSVIGTTSFAYQERFKDLYSSVVVGATFKLTVDNSAMDFGFINPGQSYELYPNRYYNEVTCLSNTGKPWYLKMSLVTGLHGAKGSVIPKKNLTWSVYSVEGGGAKPEGWSPFEDTPVLIYSATSEDSRGEPVKVRLKYKLDVPGDVTADSYATTIIYSMTETP